MPNGGGADIKNQTKSVNFTSNGRKIVEYDEGYTGLEAVNINVAVPSSGGGGTTDTVIDTHVNAPISDLITEINVSTLFPTEGINGTNKYTLQTAIAKVPQKYQRKGMVCSFIDISNKLQHYYYVGGLPLEEQYWFSLDENKQDNILKTEKTNNLFNEFDIVTNRLVANNGDFQYMKGWATSNFIPIRGGMEYYITATKVGRNGGLAWYDKDYNLISGNGDNFFDKTLIAPINATYVVFNVASYGNYSENIMLNEGSTALSYEPYRKINIKNISGNFSEAPIVFSNAETVDTRHLQGIKALYIDTSHSTLYKDSDFVSLSNTLRDYNGRYELLVNLSDESYLYIKLNKDTADSDLNIYRLADGTVFYVVIDWSKYDLGLNSPSNTKNYGYFSDCCFNMMSFNIISSFFLKKSSNTVSQNSSQLLLYNNSFHIENINLLNPNDLDIVKGHYLSNEVLSQYAVIDTSGFIKVEEGRTYKLLSRKNAEIIGGNKNNMRFVNYYSSAKKFINTEQNKKEITIPSGVAYVRISVYNGISNTNANLIKLSDISFCESNVSEYIEYNKFQVLLKQSPNENPNHIATNASVEQKILKLGNTKIKTVTLQNSDKILFAGCSYDESVYSLKKKNYFDKLSNMIDWVCGNVGVSGYRIIDIVDMLRRNKTVNGIDAKTFKPTYITIANNGNETLPTSGKDLDLYWEQARLANNYIESLGAKMILGTNYHVNSNPFVESMLKTKADELRIPYMGIGWLGSNIISQDYKGFWGGTHPRNKS